MNSRISVVQSDITQLEVDAIVNAANSGLRGGGGVDWAVHSVGGHRIMEECRKIGGCPIGGAVITSGGNLKAPFVIHAVGPIWNGGTNKEDSVLASAYRNSLNLAVEKKIKTIAFPNISTGIYGFPKERAAKVVLREVNDFLAGNESVRQVIFCCFDPENYDLYKKLIPS